MRRILPLLLVLLLPVLLAANAIPGMSVERPRFAGHILKIQLSPEAIARTNLPTEYYSRADSFGIDELDELAASYGSHKIIRAHIRMKDQEFERRSGFDRWFLITYDKPINVMQALRAFKAYSLWIQEAIPEYYAYTTVVPNDTYYPNNWGHNNTAQFPSYSGSSHSGPLVGTIGFDADMQLAWDQSQGYGSASIIIAIIDTGVDTAHPDLRLVSGYDYGDNDSNPMDDSADPGHGTACSGVAAGRANNALGVTGVAGGCSVMPLKIADSAGNLGFTAIENALTHAGNNGVHVASMSFGAEGGMAEGDSPSTDTALEYAYAHGVTLLAATANSNASTIAYPSNHNKVISVGASSPTGQRKSPTSSDGENWWGSNYGVATQDNQNAVDVMAPTILPATDITGAGGYDSGNYSMWFNGTSCATPYAAGVAALIKSKDPSLTPAQVRTAMVSTATDMTFDGGAGWDAYTGYGLVNANNALNSLIPGMPSCQITAPTGGSVIDLNSTVTVNVTATDTDGTISNVKFYIDDVLQNTDTASPWTWNWNTTGYAGGSHTIKAVATDNASLSATSTVTITLLAPPDEGFETGNFNAFAWVNTSAIPWTVQSSDKYSGTYAAKSGAITHSGTTDLSVTMVISSSGNISFFQKVSSESGYDYLRFFIDGVQQGQWSGSGSWTQQSYAVTSGTHTFLWRYLKDTSVSSGSDCAWIDHIVFPPRGTYYAPPQNFTATPSHLSVKLDWQAPASGTPTGYKIYKNSSLLTTVTGLTYTDLAVTNGTTYSYYVKAAYTGGDSDATSTVNATPNAVAPTNLVATSGNQIVNLTWTGATGRQELEPIGTSDRTINGYKVYRNGSYLASASSTNYTDSAVVNGTTYSYYVTTVYTSPAGESAASNTVQATPNVLTSVIIGSGTSSTGTNEGAPINQYYKSLHGQSIYTVAELNAAGLIGAATITGLGFNITGLPTNAMPNFVVRMKHTTASNVASWVDNSNLTTVYSSASYLPTATGWNMYTLSTPFLWDGTSNILVDTAFGLVTAWTSTGTVQYTSVTNGYHYVRLDTADQTNVFSGGTVSVYRPNVKINFQQAVNEPLILVNPTSISFGDVEVGETSAQTFTIQNVGSATLSGSISTPNGFSVAETRADIAPGAFSEASTGRNVLPFTVNTGATKSFTLTFAPTALTSYAGNVTITSNAANNPSVNIAVSGVGIIAPIISVDPPQLQAELLPDATLTQNLIIHNYGSQPLHYTIALQEVRAQNSSTLGTASNSGRSIAGSTLTLDTDSYLPGSTLDWTFTVYNASTDSEWLEDIYITFPAGVTVNSATTFAGGSGGALNPDLTSGNGITIHWNGSDGSGWGLIHGGESAVATINVTINPSFGGNLALPFQINGDVYNAEPHVLYGEITLTPIAMPLPWLDVDTWAGTVSPFGTNTLEVYYDATGLLPGTYNAMIVFTCNDPDWPEFPVPVEMVVTNPNQPPAIALPDHFDFPKNDTLVEDFSAYVSDPDNDPLTLTCIGNTNIDVEIDGLMVTFSSPTSWVGIENMTFTVSDGLLQDSGDAAVNSYNTPPWLELPAGWGFARNGSLVVDLSPYGGDDDGDMLDITIIGNTHIDVVLIGTVATFTAPGGWVGTEPVTFTVEDGYDQAHDTVLITVTNNAPTIDLPLNFAFDMGQQLVVDFAPYVQDANGDPLSLQYSGNTNVNVAIDGFEVTLSAVPDWYGMETITFTVSDGVDQTDGATNVTVNFVLSYLDPPVVAITGPSGAVTLQWEAVDNATQYRIYRSDDPAGPFTLIATTPDTSWQDTTGWDKAFYQVKAFNPVSSK